MKERWTQSGVINWQTATYHQHCLASCRIPMADADLASPYAQVQA